MNRSWKEMPKEHKIDFVKRHALSGKSAGQIAAMLTGASRNAIIGFCHRNELPLGVKSVAKAMSGGGPIRKKKVSPPWPYIPKKKREKPPKDTKSKEVEVMSDETEVAEVSPPVKEQEPVKPANPNILQLTNTTCRWPLFTSYKGMRPEEMIYCGDETGVESFCGYHNKIAYVPR